jgi:hypothetical protein
MPRNRAAENVENASESRRRKRGKCLGISVAAPHRPLAPPKCSRQATAEDQALERHLVLEHPVRWAEQVLVSLRVAGLDTGAVALHDPCEREPLRVRAWPVWRG